MCLFELKKFPPVSPADCPPMPDRLSLGFIIRRIREANGMTQSELARLAGLNLSYISTVESSVNNISIKKMFLICNALQLPAFMMMEIQQNIGGAAVLENRQRTMTCG